MGTVYRVLDTMTQRQLALKRLSPASTERALLVRAFEREFQVLASLSHPRIIRVFDYGIDSLGPYYTMEFIEGQDLRKAAPLPPREACMYLRDVATCLALLHARRLIHRDLSPGNVRRTGDGHCKLLDFGALTPFGQPDVLVGTAPGVPPEAFAFAPLDQRADLYSLGALAYWMVTGRYAYPAHRIDELPALWKRPPPPPSSLNSAIPAELDQLILSLLSVDPLARPGSAAEVIARLSVIGQLPEEDTTQAENLAQSFLLNPRFIGRADDLATIRTYTESAARRSGKAVRVEAISGMGRTRFLEEIAVRAQLAGATVLRVDASVHRSRQGTSRELALCLFDALPAVARECAARFRKPLAALGKEVAARLGKGPELVVASADGEAESTAGLEDWFAEISHFKPLAVLVDDVQGADDLSLGLLASLAKLSETNRLLVVVTERKDPTTPESVGLVALRNHSSLLELPALSADEMFELAHSLFGDAPNIRRFAQWLHERTSGSPLHAMEIVRQLVEREVIRHTGGIWTLPADKPDADLPAALEDALSLRVARLSEPARILAECISLQREEPTFELCRLISGQPDDQALFLLLDELARNDVLYPDRNGHRFSSTAIRDVLLSGMDEKRLEQNHFRLGQALAKLADSADFALRIEAGWHLIQGGEEMRGAEMIARSTHDAVTIRTLLVNLHRAGGALEAALSVYGRRRRSIYERLPLLAALAQAGYYEDRRLAERYGDAALDVLDDVCGLRSARRLRPFLGRFLSLVLGMLLAFVRFKLAPSRERPYTFFSVLIHLFGTVTTLTGTAALSLDTERSTQVAELLEPFSVLPERLTPVGIYQFCRGLREISRDNEAVAYDTFDRLLQRFENPRYYPTLPAEARKLYIGGIHYARAAFAIFRAHGETALESSHNLERSGFKLYAMIASQLRFLYHMNRGEFSEAAVHREQMELHAAHVGFLWQVETWEAPALTLVFTTLSDVVSSTHVAHRLELLARSVPSLKRHNRLAKLALMRSRGDDAYFATAMEEYDKDLPRSYIGWAAARGFLALSYNEHGRHEEAKQLLERTLAETTDADREYVTLFLGLDIQLAISEAGLGRADKALERLDRLLDRFSDCDHPLVHGLLHEARARICLVEGDLSGYRQSLAEVERWFLPTGTPILIARCKRLAELKRDDPESTSRVRCVKPSAGDMDLDGSVATAVTVQHQRTQLLCGTEGTDKPRESLESPLVR